MSECSLTTEAWALRFFSRALSRWLPRAIFVLLSFSSQGRTFSLLRFCFFVLLFFFYYAKLSVCSCRACVQQTRTDREVAR